MLPPLLSGPLPPKPLWSVPPAAFSPSSDAFTVISPAALSPSSLETMSIVPPETITLPSACTPVSTYTPPSMMVTSLLPESATATV